MWARQAELTQALDAARQSRALEDPSLRPDPRGPAPQPA
jgi:hypothetical protein